MQRTTRYCSELQEPHGAMLHATANARASPEEASASFAKQQQQGKGMSGKAERAKFNAAAVVVPEAFMVEQRAVAALSKLLDADGAVDIDVAAHLSAVHFQVLTD